MYAHINFITKQWCIVCIKVWNTLSGITHTHTHTQTILPRCDHWFWADHLQHCRGNEIRSICSCTVTHTWESCHGYSIQLWWHSNRYINYKHVQYEDTLQYVLFYVERCTSKFVPSIGLLMFCKNLFPRATNQCVNEWNLTSVCWLVVYWIFKLS